MDDAFESWVLKMNPFSKRTASQQRLLGQRMEQRAIAQYGDRELAAAVRHLTEVASAEPRVAERVMEAVAALRKAELSDAGLSR